MKNEFLKNQLEALFPFDTALPARRSRTYRIDVTTANRDMLGSVRVIAAEGGGDITEFDLLCGMYAAGLKNGINFKTVADIINNKRLNEAIPVSAGTAPVNGEDARIDPRVMLEEFTTKELLKQFPGQVIRKGVPVDLDEVIAEKIPATEGDPGFTVKNRMLLSQPGKDVAFEYGEGAALSEDGLCLLAAMPGMAGLSNGKIAVKDAEYETWKYDVKLRRNNMEAVITIVPGLTAQPQHDAAWFTSIVEKHRLGFGVDRDAWRFIPTNLRSTFTRVIAQGEPPLAGDDAQIIEHYRDAGAHNGRVIFPVAAGQLIAEKIPVKKGARGRDVLDEPVEPAPGKDVELATGPNTRLSDDGLKLYAEADGYISLVKDAYAVVPGKELDAASLPPVVNFGGVVRVVGDVPRGHTIVASHHVEILGGVQAANVISGGILHVHGIVSDCAQCRIQASGDIFISGAEHSRLRTEQNVYISEKAFETHIIAGGAVMSRNGVKTTLAGGSVIAGRGMRIAALGASPSVATRVFLGVPFPLRERYGHATSEIVTLINRFGILNNAFLPLHKKLIAKQLTRDEAPIYKKLRQTRDNLAERIRVSKAVIANLKLVLSQTAGSVIADVDSMVYPGVVIAIGTQKYQVEKRIRKCIISTNTDGDTLRVEER